MCKNLAFPTSLLPAVLKLKEPLLLLLQPPQLETQTLTSDFTASSAHLGERNGGPRITSLETIVLLIIKSPTCLDYSHVEFHEGNMGESWAPLKSLHKQRAVLGQNASNAIAKQCNRKTRF